MSTPAISGLVAAIQEATPRLNGESAMAYEWGWNACREAVLEAIANYLNT